jgi:hypothetical protein
MFVALLIMSLTFTDSTHVHYAQQDVEALRSMLQEAETRGDRLLCRYRLYPLTEDATYIDDIPDELDDGTARELALLAGLWGFRAAEASFINAIRYGRRSSNLLEEARKKDPDEPFLLLIEGQSFLFRPAIAGKDVERALSAFQQLQEVLNNTEESGVPMTEARLWTWYALRELGRDEAADKLHTELMRADPPPLFRQFLLDPPRS